MHVKSVFNDRFDDTVNHTLNLHPTILKQFKTFPAELKETPSLILYGPEGAGKYTLALKWIRMYSPQKLKYEKKLSLWCASTKTEYFIKISDIHYEVDMAALGCNAKSLWHDLFTQLIDSIYLKKNRSAIILCKNFHEINNELLDVFYSYLQPLNNVIFYGVNIKFVLLTTQLSFIHESVLGACRVVAVPMPNKATLVRCFKRALPDCNNLVQYKFQSNDVVGCQFICDNLVKMLKSSTFKISKFREQIYEFLSYNMDIHSVMWYVVQKTYPDIGEKSGLLMSLYSFFRRFNNNYRPIFHLELIFLIIHFHVKKNSGVR